MAEDPDTWDALDYTRWCGPFEERDRGWNWWSADHWWRSDHGWHNDHWWSGYHAWLSDDRDSQSTDVAPLTFNRVTATDNAHTVQAARYHQQPQRKAAPSRLQVPAGTGAAAVAPLDAGAAEHDSVCAAGCLRLLPAIEEEPGPPPATDLPEMPEDPGPLPAAMSPGIHPTFAKGLQPPLLDPPPPGFKAPPQGLFKPKAPPVLPTASKWSGTASAETGPPPKVRPPGVGPTPTKPPPLHPNTHIRSWFFGPSPWPISYFMKQP